MSLEKILKKVFSITIAVALILQQGSFAFAINVDNWADLRSYVASSSGSYNVTESLTASTSAGTLNVPASGRTVTGYSLTENSYGDTLINVGSGVSFGLSNSIYGKILNNGILNYSGSALGGSSFSRAITGTGALNLTGSSVSNYDTVSQGSVSVGASTNLSNNGAITASTFTNNGTVSNAAAITASITNAGTLTSSATNLVGAVSNNGALTLTGGNVRNAISGSGNTSITGDLTSNYDITQNSISVSNDAVFANNGMLLAAANVASGASLNSDPDNLGDDVTNNGTLNLNADGTLGVNVSGSTGTTNINGDLTNQGIISQKDITVANGKVVTTNASNMSATGAITNNGIINYTAGTTNNTINGTGRVDINGYVTNTGAMDQTTVSNNGIFTNNGTVDANLVNHNAIEGTGSITTKTGISSNDGTISQASLTNNGTFDNNGHITLTGALTNNSTFNTNADLLSAAGGIDNQSALNITGGTNKNVITGGGTTSFTSNVTNDRAITQAFVNNSGNLTNNALITADVANSGTLTTNGANIVGDVNNTGSYVVSNGNTSGAITGTGTTSILGTTTNNGTITQDKVIVGNAGAFTTASDTVTAAIENEGALTWNGGTTNNNAISGSGDLTVAAGADVLNLSTINQNSITVNTSGALTSDASMLTSANGLINYGDLAFLSGTNNNEIFGTGDLSILGLVTNNALIEQNSIDVSLGKLTTDAGMLSATGGIVNDSEISFTGGDNNNAITGSGMTYIDGTVQNLANISTKIQVNTGAHYGTATDVQNKIDNRGTTDLIDADIAAGGKISGTGTTNILGDTVNNGTITQNAVVVASNGSLTTNSQDVNSAVTNDGTLIWNAGASNANVIDGTGALQITGGTIANSAAISQGSIAITGGSLTSDADLLATVGGIDNGATLTITGGTNNNVITGTGVTDFANTVINKASITQSILGNSGDFTNDAGVITADIINTGNFLNQDGLITGSILNSGTLASEGDGIVGAITNTGNYEIITGDNSNNISGAGALYIYGDTKNTGTISQDTVTVNTGASLVATNMDNVSAYSGITNAGVLEMQSGTNNNAISGNTGTVKVTGTVTNTSGKTISQDILEIATLGNFTADAGDITTVDGIANDGALTFGNGATANAISGNGTLTVTGTVTNTGAIEQKSLTNNGTLTSDADLLAFADGINNTNILNITGGTNGNVITGAAGTTNFTGDAVNNGAITQANVTNAAGVLTNNAAITAAFANNGGTVNNEAAITGAITNTGTMNSAATNLVGTVDNTGTLNVAGGEVQNTITGATGIMNITDDLVNAQSITQNTVNNGATMTNSGAITVSSFINGGIVDNSAAITGAITNNGMMTSAADYLVGPVANSGTLNLNGGTMQDVVTGTGITNIITDLTSAYNITQDSVTNAGNFTNNATVTATTITNSGTITGKASDLVASSGITNDGKLVFNATSTGASAISGTGNIEVKADTTLTGNNSFTGGTLIDGSTLSVAGQNNLSTADVSFANNGVLQVTGAGALSNNLLGQAATDNLRVQNDAALTLNGTMSSAADFHKSGAGTMTLAMASNTYTGDTYVDAGTLIGNTQNIKNTVNGVAGTTVEFTDTTDAELNAINTLGNFVQSGSAVLNVSSNAFSAAQADINAGTFAANRALTATNLNVNGGTLRGNGNITGTVNVNAGGTIAPGNSIDTLTITGDLNLASGSTTAIEINETPASDKLVVTGATNIAGGANLTVTNENGRYFEWKSFDILESAGNVTGTFTYDGSIAGYDTSRIDVEADYSDPTKVTLTAKRKATSHEDTAGLTRNQSEAARAMDAVSTGFGGDITNALLQLEALGGLNPQGVTPINAGSTLQSALDDIHGVLYANAALTPLFNAKTAHVYDRISKRNPSNGKCPTCHDNVWAEYYSQYDKVYADANSPRFTNNMTGVLVGYDRSNEDVLLGVYGGSGKSDLRQQSDTMDIDDVSLGFYGGYTTGDWVFKGTLFGGYQTYHGKRDIDFMARRAEGKYHGMNMALDLEGGYNIAVYDWLNFKPFVGVLGNYTHVESFTETGADSLNLHVESKNQFNTQARLGVQLDGKLGKRFNWYGSVAVKEFIGGDYAKLHMSLDMPNTRMEIISAELGRTYFSGQVGASYALTDNLSVFGNLDTGVNNKSANCYGNLGLAYAW